eukprot:XP_011668402.1 PREDICTED: trichohyalin isoform X2 [Strongylocentrotus purpuratus]
MDRRAVDKMTSGIVGGLQLSDIMAAFDIQDAGDLPCQSLPPVPSAPESLVPAPSLPVLETATPNMDVNASTLLASIASMVSPASSIDQPTGRLGTYVKQRPHFTGQQSDRQSLEIKLNTTFRGPSSSQSLGLPATDFKQATHFCDPVSSMANGMKTSMEFRHQHEAAIEFDQLQEHSQPVLVYSKEDWPSPDTNLQTNIYSGITHRIRARKTRSEGLRAFPQKSQRQVRERNNQQTLKPSIPYRGKKQNEPTLKSDSFKPFHSVMTLEHRSLISKGLSDSDMIELFVELQELLRAKHRDSKRLRRARLNHEQLEEERRRNRERKRRSRQDPFIEFRHIMTEEQRKLLLQPDLDPTTRDTIMTEFIAIRKWINREQKRKRRSQMTEERKAEERRKSREYKRRARSNPLRAFRSVITERHNELLHKDLNREQRENLVEELIELRKAKQRDEMRKRRASFSSEQRDRERSYSREYQRKRHQRTQILYEWDSSSVGITNTDVNERIQLMPQPELLIKDSTARVNEEANPVQDPGLSVVDDAQVDEQANPMPDPGLTARSVEGSISCETVNMPTESSDLLGEESTYSKLEQEKLKNKIRQRRRRARQTEEEREEEKRKNRERSRMRRKRLAEIEKVVARGRSQTKDSLSNPASDTGLQESMGYDHWKAVNIKTETDFHQRQVTESPNNSCPSADQTPDASPQSELLTDQPVPWFTKQFMDQLRKRNRECTQRARSNMTEEQREQERERNRERQRLRRLLQTPEERTVYIEKQRNIRRLQRQDSVYRENERERQRLRKKELRESPSYRIHENTLYHLRKARKINSPKMYMPLEDNELQEVMGDNVSQEQECSSKNSDDMIHSCEYDELEKELNKSDSKYEGEESLEEFSVNDDEDEDEEEDESDSDFEIMYQRSVKVTKPDTREGLEKEARKDKEDLRVKISTSIFGLHKIVPLNH